MKPFKSKRKLLKELRRTEKYAETLYNKVLELQEVKDAKTTK